MQKYDIIQDLLPLGRDYNRPGTPLNPQGIEIHDTDTPGATDENERAYEGNGYHGSSAHIFIDWDSIRQIIPDNEQAWGAGPTANRQFIHVEMCVPASHDPIKFREVWNRTVWCVAYKCIKYGWSTGPDVWSHRGTSDRWGETDHQDPVAFLAEYGESWESLLAAIDAEIQQLKKGGKGFMNLILVGHGPDERAAGYLSDFLQAPVAYLDSYKQSDIDVAQNVYVVGGNQKPVDRAILISGGDRYATCAKVLEFIAKGGK